MDKQLTEFYINDHHRLVAFLRNKAFLSLEDAEELAQNTYESLITYPNYNPNFKENNTFKSYVYQVARKMVADFLEHGRNYWSYTKTYVEKETLPIIEATQEMLIQQKQTLIKIYAFLQSLPPKQASVAKEMMEYQAYVDRHKHDSYAEIKDKLGISETNITSTWQIVLNKGRKFFNKLDFCY